MAVAMARRGDRIWHAQQPIFQTNFAQR